MGYPVKGNKKRANEVLNAKIKEFKGRNIQFYSNMTVAKYFEMWLQQIKLEVRPKTYRSYKKNMENHMTDRARVILLAQKECKTVIANISATVTLITIMYVLLIMEKK